MRSCLMALAIGVLLAFPAGAEEGFVVKTLVADRVFPGTTLFTHLRDDDNRILEIDHQGRVLWRYTVPSHLVNRHDFVLEAAPQPGGTVLFTVRGGGIYEIDRSGAIVWQHKDAGASHDVDRLPGGTILYNRGWAGQGEAAVREITPDGRTVWEWTGLDNFPSAEARKVSREGWLHVNSVTRLDNGDTLISVRNLNTILAVDPEGRTRWSCSFKSPPEGNFVGYVADGKVRGEANHEPELLANGTILLALRRPNMFHEIDPGTCESVWSWGHPLGPRTLDVNRDANRLPNGNSLFVAADRIIEVAADGTIVWEVVVSSTNFRNTKQFHKAIRIGPDGTVFGG